jgi:hypothetical protein
LQVLVEAQVKASSSLKELLAFGKGQLLRTDSTDHLATELTF